MNRPGMSHTALPQHGNQLRDYSKSGTYIRNSLAHHNTTVTYHQPRVTAQNSESPVLLIEGERSNLANLRISGHTGTLSGPNNLIAHRFNTDSAGIPLINPTNITGNSILTTSFYIQSPEADVRIDVNFGGVTAASRTITRNATKWYPISITTPAPQNAGDMTVRASSVGRPGVNEIRVCGFQIEPAPFASSRINPSFPSTNQTTRAADVYLLKDLHLEAGPKTINIAGYFNANRPPHTRHYWWVHTGHDFIRQEGNLLQVNVGGQSFASRITDSRFIPVTLSDTGVDTHVWVDGHHIGSSASTITPGAPSAYGVTDKEGFAFTYLAFGSSELRIPFVNPYEDASGLDVAHVHSVWAAVLDSLGVSNEL